MVTLGFSLSSFTSWSRAAVVLLTYFKAWNYIFDWAVNVVCVSHSINWLHIIPFILLLPTATMLVSSVFVYREMKLS